MVVDQRFDSVGVHCHALSVAYITMTFKYHEHEEWKAFSVDLRRITLEKQGLRQKQQGLMNQIKTLQLAEDLAMHKKWSFEGITKKQVKTLEEHTGQCDDCWWSDYQAAEDAIEEMRIAKCVEVANLQANFDVLTEKYSLIDKKQDACRDRLIKEHNEKQAEESKETVSA